ncbi:MAG: DMT family transporter [Desulfobacterales bacterium]|nr:DMT family transporter [Desulfobacterales bacterium]
MKPKNAYLDFKSIFLLIILSASWGFNQVAIKVTNESVPPVLQAGIRSIGAAFLVMAWMRYRGYPLFEKDKTLLWGILVGILFSVEFILIYCGLDFTTASRAVIFLYTTPFFVAVGAALFIPGEKLGAGQVLGLCLAFIGIITAFNESVSMPSGKMLTGDIMMFAAAALWGATTVIIKASPLAAIKPGKTLFYQLAVSGAFMPAASIMLNEPGLANMTSLGWSSLAFQIIWIAFITYFTWFWLISNYSVSRLSSFTFLTPMFGVLSGIVFLNEPLTLNLIVALFMVGSGIYVVNRKTARKNSTEQAQGIHSTNN